MTLTPSVRAISLCSFPCVARSFACASFDAISTLECLFFLAIAASLRPANVISRPANVISHVRILLRRLNGPYKDLTRTLQGPYKDLTRTLQRPYKDLTRTLQGPYKDLTRNELFSCRFRNAE